MKGKILLLIVTLSFFKLNAFAQTYQTTLGKGTDTRLEVYEYYHHTGEEKWLKLFTINNSNWSYGGVSGRVYFVDYQGVGGSYVDFAFPQTINSWQKPTLFINGNSCTKLKWYITSNDVGSYTVYVKTPTFHLGLSFLYRGSSYVPHFAEEGVIPTTFVWSSENDPESLAFFRSDGNWGLGTTNPTHKLTVNGQIRAREIKVENDNWPDYVFEKQYQPMTLNNLAAYISKNGHLPEIPSATEVKKEGVNLSALNAKMLQKIEELTLYIIDQQKEIESLKRQNEKIPAMEKDIAALKKASK
ncbi:hypothetical protein [Pararcticibacter amylolyticus]|nr:hypothetical protein [Pararcticibacter amylolyticus]